MRHDLIRGPGQEVFGTPSVGSGRVRRLQKIIAGRVGQPLPDPTRPNPRALNRPVKSSGNFGDLSLHLPLVVVAEVVVVVVVIRAHIIGCRIIVVCWLTVVGVRLL